MTGNDDIFRDTPPPGGWPGDDDDDFERRTFDTGQFEAVQPPDDDPPALNAQDEADEAAFWDDTGDQAERDAADDAADDDDDFVAYSLEPAVAAPPAARPMARPAPSYRRERARRRQRARREQRPVSVWLSTLRAVLVVVVAAGLVSTIFSLWTRPTFFSEEFRAGLNRVQATQQLISIQPTPLPTDVRVQRIGIVAGHSGPPLDPSFDVDPGAVCDDGLTELSINETVARQVVAILQGDKYTVDLLQEFDPRLSGYQADVLVSIHTNDCGDYGAAGTGFNVAAASARQTTTGADERLLACLVEEYAAATGLSRHFGLTFDMTDYHTFREISVDTPTAIIELGFMRMDRAILTTRPEVLALGVANGIRCFMNP